MEDYISLNFFTNDSSASMSLRQDSSNAIVLPRLAISAFSLTISLLRLSMVSFALRSSFTRNSMFVICLPFWLLHYYYTISFSEIQIELQNSIRIIFGIAKVFHYSIDSVISILFIEHCTTNLTTITIK